MYRLLIFSCLCHLSLSEQNITELQIQKIPFPKHNGNFTYRRIIRAASNRPRGEKPVDCHKLHGTDDSAFVAILLNKLSGRLLCMGSIIDERHILTANPCVLNIDVKNLRVLLGYFKAWWGRHSYVFYVEKILKHEHDLVILRLTKMITFSRTIRPIKLLRVEDGVPAPPQPPATNPGANSKMLDGNNNNDNSSEVTPSAEGKNEDKNEPKDAAAFGKEEENNISPETNPTTLQSSLPVTKPQDQTSSVRPQEEPKDGDDRKETPQKEDSEKKDGDKSSTRKVYRKKKVKKIQKRQAGENIVEFWKTHPTIETILLVGFPLSRFDVQGEPISQTIIYSMKEENITKKNDCVNIYHTRPVPADDKIKDKRDFCTGGNSKLCWGCLGGPTLFKKDNEYIQVGVVGGANCDDEKIITPYLHIRVDIHMNWIMANSLIPPKL